MADRPLRPANHRRLGGPLPHQQAKGTQTHPPAINLSTRRFYPVLAPVSKSCPRLKGRSSTRYSPVRHFNHFRRSFLVRLACVKHAASVRPEPGSNSQVIILCLFLLINVRLRAYMHPDRNRLSVCSDSLFKELAFSSCKPYNASSSLNYCQYFYFKER